MFKLAKCFMLSVLITLPKLSYILKEVSFVGYPNSSYPPFMSYGDGFGYLGKILIHHTTGAEVYMAYFRVTHLPFG